MRKNDSLSSWTHPRRGFSTYLLVGIAFTKRAGVFVVEWNSPSILMKYLIYFFTFVSTCIGEIPPEIRLQFLRLNSILHEADQAYFNRHDSIMSDSAYDHIRSACDRLIDHYPSLDTRDGCFEETVFQGKISHVAPVLSLKKAYSDSDLKAFVSKFGRDETLLIQPKIDGVSVVLHYKQGCLVEAITRGNSLEGNDVTNAVVTSGAVPLVLQNSSLHLWLRGEFFISEVQFQKINELRSNEGLKPLSNVRNAASGTLMSRDLPRILKRKPEILIFELIDAQGISFKSDVEALAFLCSNGFSVVPYWIMKPSFDLDETLQRVRDSIQFPFLTDGFVVKVNDLALRKELGSTKKYPRWAIARKFRSEPVVTDVLDIEISVSENGKRTPVAVLKPVKIEGVVVKRASLHSESILQQMGVRIGSQVQVIRAGGVTPEIVGVVEK